MLTSTVLTNHIHAQLSISCCCYINTLAGDVPMPKPQSGRVVYVSFYVLVVLLVALYAGNLTATLAVSDVRMPFDTLDELAKSNNYIFQVRVGAFREQIFRVGVCIGM